MITIEAVRHPKIVNLIIIFLKESIIQVVNPLTPWLVSGLTFNLFNINGGRLY
jgi:hypothetical protein